MPPPWALLTRDSLHTAAPLYTALLSSTGRVLYDAFLHPLEGAPGAPPRLLADVCSASAQALRDHLLRFRLRAAVSVEDATTEWRVWTRFGESPSDAEPPVCGDSHWRGDPRGVPALGHRALLPAAAAASPASPDAHTAAHRQHRLRCGVAEGAAELGGELPLELNLDLLHAVSFTKGCYVGQELTSRTHFRGVIRKRAMPFSLLGGAQPHQVQRGEDVLDENGLAVGRVLAVQGGAGVALMRLASALRVTEGGFRSASGALLQLHRPDWWPPELAAAAESAS